MFMLKNSRGFYEEYHNTFEPCPACGETFRSQPREFQSRGDAMRKKQDDPDGQWTVVEIIDNDK